MSAGIKNLQDSDFDATISSGTVLVDFWAPWCGPCRMQGPILEEVASAVGDKAVIAKLDVDTNQRSAAKYGVQSIPTLILFKDGQPAQHFVGVQRRETLMEAIGQATAVSA